MREIFAPDLRFVDHRLVGWGELEGADAFVEIVWGGVALAPDLRIDAEPSGAGQRGRRRAGIVTRGHLADGGGEFEIAWSRR